MTNNKIVWLFALVFVVSIAILTAINWCFVPGWQITPGGFWKILGNSIGYVSLFFFGLVSTLYYLGLVGNKKETKNGVVSFIHQLPGIDEKFVGRVKQLQVLKEKHKSGEANVFGINGMGGIGKTMLAITFAKSVASSYDAEIFLDMRGVFPNPVAPEEVMLYVVRSFFPSYAESGNTSLIAGAYRSVFHDRKVLLLLDNVKDEEQIRPLIPPANTSTLIYTSRQKFLLANSYTLDLPLMSKVEARQLLQRITDRISDSASKQISELCGYLPNALAKAGNSLQEYVTLDVESYIEKLSKAESKIGLVEATTSLSYNLLSDQLKKAWRQLSVFPEGFGMEAVEKILERDLDSCEKILINLVRVSMLHVYNSRPSRYKGTQQVEVRFKFHDLDRLFADTKMKPAERKKVQLKFVKYYERVLRVISEMFDRGEADLLFALDAFDREWVNIEYGQAISTRYSKTNTEAADYCVGYSLNSVGFLDIRMPKKKIVEWSNVALDIARRNKDLVVEGIALNNLGTAYSDMGEFDRSLPLLKRSLEIAEKTNNDKLELARLANLGNVYRRKEDTVKALEYHTRAYNKAKTLSNHDFQTTELLNIGNVYRDMDDKTKALKCHQLVLEKARERGDKLTAVKAYLNIAIDYQELGKKFMTFKYCRLTLLASRELGAKQVEVMAVKIYNKLLSSIGLSILSKMFFEEQK